jgi:hypothetical protein
MQNNYYYFAATFPSLSLGAAPEWTLEQFAMRCRDHLSPEDLLALEELLNDSASPRHPFLQAWLAAETALRNGIVKARAERLRSNPARYEKPQQSIDLQVADVVADAFDHPSPLERELILARWRWQKADELAGYNTFSINAVLAYAIKLRLAGRWAGLSEAEGLKKIDQLVVEAIPESLFNDKEFRTV